MALGKKTGGRVAGTPNKLTTSVKQALESVYEGLGGDTSLLEWARENPGIFYKDLWGKMLPMNIDGNVAHTVNWPLPKTELDK